LNVTKLCPRWVKVLQGFAGWSRVRTFLAWLALTMEVEPEGGAQVDFWQGAWVVVDGKRKLG
jgi:hypothetical protein